MIGIIGAMSVEMEKLISLTEKKEETIVGSIRFTKGILFGTEAVLATCGIGKVFAGICTQTMILTFHTELIINVGVGGTLTDKLSVTDIAIADALVQHDMDTSPLGDPVGLISGINIVEIPCDKELSELLCRAAESLGIRTLRGVIASGDQFIASGEQKERITSTFGAIACEMEGAAIGQVCYVNKVRVAVVRAISDSADGSANLSYGEFTQVAAENSARVLAEFCRLYTQKQ
ncbi:MAG: 5'-methylthioadenosine/adenosylhomocysteine nucleosidase [Clostridia bacterium]|nr:5'-methylthioadenosine/adenosylhomocysteine nucleosidase [Clostridia bacterium]